ncbi:MAG: hypothetical protein SOT69_03375 [Mesosutterella sp.]|nr:hypothetical protein [Mesosutterella sp.]
MRSCRVSAAGSAGPRITSATRMSRLESAAVIILALAAVRSRSTTETGASITPIWLKMRLITTVVTSDARNASLW